jgi:cytochrome b561
MAMRNSKSGYGWMTIVLHWLVAVAVAGLFVLGFWMVELTYYDSWYSRAPDIHRSIGVLLFVTVLFRVVWRWINLSPRAPVNHTRWEVWSARAVHMLLYVLMFVAMASGYLISTADGSAISVFGWFDVPSVTGRMKGLEETAGEVHYWSTWGLVALAGLHGLAALKHHFWDRDQTLLRMLGQP